MANDVPLKSNVKLLLGFISQDLAHSMRLLAEDVGMELTSVYFDDADVFTRLARTADVVFLQWDGRANTAHDLMAKWAQKSSGPQGALYAVTASKIHLEALSPKVSKQLGIAGWFDIPVQADKLKTELSLLAPDAYDDPAADLRSSGLDKVFDTPLLRLRGRHLIGDITASWDKRSEAQRQFMRSRDEAQRAHLTVFASDAGVARELTQFLIDAKYKNFSVFSQVDDALKLMRGHTSDLLIAWYDAGARATEELLHSRLESRSSKRIPVVVLHADPSAAKMFQDKNPRIHVDVFLHFDRSRENFRYGIVEAFDKSKSDSNPMQVLEELRALPREQSAPNKPTTQIKSCPSTIQELDILCDRLAAEPGKTYWADAERLLGYARLKDAQKFESLLMVFSSRYSHFDSQIVMGVARSQIFKDEAPSAAHGLMVKVSSTQGLNSDRLFRAGMFFVKVDASASLKSLLDHWWNNQDRHPIDHQFFFLASRYANLGQYKALERSLLAMALNGDPLRNDYVEAYAQHLYLTDHPGHVVMLSEFLAVSKYFPHRRGQALLLNAHVKLRNVQAVLKLVRVMLRETPEDKTLLAIEKKYQALPTN